MKQKTIITIIVSSIGIILILYFLFNYFFIQLGYSEGLNVNSKYLTKIKQGGVVQFKPRIRDITPVAPLSPSINVNY